MKKRHPERQLHSPARPAVSLVDADKLLDEIFRSMPLPFLQAFLRERKERSKHVLIGSTRREVRSNLRDGILANRISMVEVERWFRGAEGWGHQHMYMRKVPKRSLVQRHLLSGASLESYLRRKNLLVDVADDAEPEVHHIDRVDVDDELARVVWVSHRIDLERRPELDETRVIGDTEYEFHAHRRIHAKSAARLIIRKTDGAVMYLLNVPLGKAHDGLLATMEQVANAVLSPLKLSEVYLSPILRALDSDAVAGFGPGRKPKRNLSLGVSPTRARYRTEGGRLEFSSTKAREGYTASDEMRRVRKSMQIAKFAGESGRFRLLFDSEDHKGHEMTVSMVAAENRIVLFSRMTESEVLTFVDELLTMSIHPTA